LHDNELLKNVSSKGMLNISFVFSASGLARSRMRIVRPPVLMSTFFLKIFALFRSHRFLMFKLSAYADIRLTKLIKTVCWAAPRNWMRILDTFAKGSSTIFNIFTVRLIFELNADLTD